MSHDLLPELFKQLSLQWLREIVSSHLSGGAIVNRQVALLNLVCKEEITNVDSVRALAGTFLTVFQ